MSDNDFLVNLIQGEILETFFSEDDDREQELLEKLGYYSEEDYFKTQNAQLQHQLFSNEVAEILLGRIQHKLPRFEALLGTELVSTRSAKPKRKSQKLEFFPQFLFSVNWASSSPFVNWIEAYWTVKVPDFGRHVLIACLDSSELYGYKDFVMNFTDLDAYDEEFLNTIKNEWDFQKGEWGQCPWEEISEVGLINKQKIFCMRDEVWNDN